MNFNFLDWYSKNTKMKFNENPVGAEAFHGDWRTNMTKLIVIFRNFVDAPKKSNFNITTKFR